MCVGHACCGMVALISPPALIQGQGWLPVNTRAWTGTLNTSFTSAAWSFSNSIFSTVFVRPAKAFSQMCLLFLITAASLLSFHLSGRSPLSMAFPDVPLPAEWFRHGPKGMLNRKAPETKQTVGLNYRKGNCIIDLSFKGICLQGKIGELCGSQMEISIGPSSHLLLT